MAVACLSWTTTQSTWSGRAILTQFGVAVAEAPDGLAAVAAATLTPFDIILMDIRMPGLDGPAAAAIRRKSVRSVTCLSAHPVGARRATVDLLGFEQRLPGGRAHAKAVSRKESSATASRRPERLFGRLYKKT